MPTVIETGTKKKTIYWTAISPWCRCSTRKVVYFFQTDYGFDILSLAAIGGSESLRNPMSLSRATREWGIINPGSCDAKKLSVFHILDSLRTKTTVTEERKLMQTILLKHFEGESFDKGRLAVNLAQVRCFPYKISTHLFIKQPRCLSKIILTTAAASQYISGNSFF